MKDGITRTINGQFDEQLGAFAPWREKNQDQSPLDNVAEAPCQSRSAV